MVARKKRAAEAAVPGTWRLPPRRAELRASLESFARNFPGKLLLIYEIEAGADGATSGVVSAPGLSWAECLGFVETARLRLEREYLASLTPLKEDPS